MIWKAIASAAAALALATPALAQDKPATAKVSLTRLDCGTVRVNRLNAFSDTDAYPGQSRDLTVSCYLIRHGDQLMLWDLGLPSALKGSALSASGDMSATVGQTLVEQLAELSIKPGDIDVVGISHYHSDHAGQLPDFPAAKLYIGKGDWDALTQSPPSAFLDPRPFTHWISGGGKVEPVARDQDIFGDGSVVMLGMPGHTPGHHTLLVRLAGMGPVLLTGDQAHFQENYDSEGVPTFNTNRADTLASFGRFKALAKNLKATVIIQHEPRDVGKLPAFPKAAE
jgi:glyoxylase-like metal-dependent hydrolase (beta-lactamase superfamily II)